MKSRLIIFSILTALLLSSCVSLAEDLTPPPNDMQQAPASEATEAPAAAPAQPDDSPIDAAALFSANCALCHGKSGKGVTVEVDLTDGERMGRFPDAMLYALISSGNESGMPAFAGKLSEAEIDALVAYLREIAEAPAEEAADAPLAESTPEGEQQAQTESDTTTEGLGTVSGTVMNGSGGELPKGLTVELQAYDHDMMTGGFSEAFTLEAALNADGSYLFEDVEIVEGRAFLAVINDGELSYSSEPDFVTAGINAFELPITYYDTSTDAAHLSVDRLHIFFEIPDTENELARVIEVFVITNPDIFAVVAENGQAVLEFELPEGAQNLQFEDSVIGERYTKTETGFGDTAAVMPGIGQHQVIVSFELPYKRNKLDFSQSINHPVDSAIVMVPQGMKVKSDLLTDSGERDAQGLIYQVYSSQPLPVGATFSMAVSGKVSSATTAASDPQKNILFGAIALGVVLIGVGIWMFMRSRDEEFDDEDELESDDAEFDNAEEIMDAIIALDDAYRAGDFNEAVYKKRRAELKAQLKDLV